MSTAFDSPDTTEAAKAGTASHWVVSSALTNTRLPLDQMGMAGVEAPNGVILDDEMIECAQVMIDEVLEHVTPADKLHVEEQLEIPGIHSTCNGPPDAWLFNGTIHLWEYKFGHKNVQPDSWQNKAYVCGIADQLGTGINDQTTKVRMTTVQPRAFDEEGPVKVWTGMLSDLRADFNILAMQAEKVYSGDPGVVSGPWCQYCPARHGCPAAREAAASAVDYAGSALPEKLTADALSFELGFLTRGQKAIEYRLTAIKAHAVLRIDKGETIPGFGTKYGLADRKFNAPTEQMLVLGDLLNIDMKAPQQLITPAEFDRRLKKLNKTLEVPIDASVINDYVSRASTGMKLVPINETLAVKAFRRNK